MRTTRLAALTLCLLGVLVTRATPQEPDETFKKFAQVWSRYRVTTKVTYLTASNWSATLDVYQPVTSAPNRTLIFFHGGGFTSGDTVAWPGGNSMIFLPFFEMGWTVVSVDYRVAKVAPAPAAVEDGLCALRWVYRNAKQYNFDVSKLVVAGQSVGGMLALTTGMVPAVAGLDRQCPGDEDLKVAAIISFFGVADVGDLVEGQNARPWAITWLGSTLQREEVAKRASPMTYVRPGLPPILSLHGDKDPTVPYAQFVRLHQALDTAGVPNELFTIPGGGHNSFNEADSVKIFAAVRNFLTKHHLF